jgi:hypothetical protein
MSARLSSAAKSNPNRWPGIHQVGQKLALVATEPEEDIPAAAHDATIVILPERVVVSDASLGALLRVERGKQSLCERVQPRP